MNTIIKKTDPTSSATQSDLSSHRFQFSIDCLPFLNWNEEELETEKEKAIIFRSLVATVNSQPALDVTLEAKAMKFLKYMDPEDEETVDVFLSHLALFSDGSSTDLIQPIVVLISSPSQVIVTATMKMLVSLICFSSTKVHLSLVEANLIPQLVITLNLRSLSLADYEHIHTDFVKIIRTTLWLATPDCLTHLKIEDRVERQAVRETVFQQVLTPTEQYLCHLCVNRYSIVDGDQSTEFMKLLARLLEISQYHQPTMDFVVNVPVVLTIPSCLAFFEVDESIWIFLEKMFFSQRKWNRGRRIVQQMWKPVLRMLRTEGIEEVTEQKLQNDRNSYFGDRMVENSIGWNHQLGMNIHKRW
ncbi:hypothetical protein BLNAU_4727 [Blattamonas nauphoetae]|uniref:Uncharacterized protein n=1 Tax=Blattamonas nauphoetae TaxID=2049346 RepID=A0ABQ9Y8Z5_9EUKA|nr:hypothetical protein BLNAU_4727 [Blattamonas nauphoetae]